MDKLRNKFINFMYGRSGPDSLYKATMIACIVLMIINIFARSIILNLLKFNMTKTMLTDKEHCYKKCSKCKTVLRLPKQKGEHTVQCPKCRESFKVKIR